MENNTPLTPEEINPAPWKVLELDDIFIIDSEGQHVCEIRNNGLHLPWKRSRANAELIASAPEMTSRIAELETYIGHQENHISTRQKAFNDRIAEVETDNANWQRLNKVWCEKDREQYLRIAELERENETRKQIVELGLVKMQEKNDQIIESQQLNKTLMGLLEKEYKSSFWFNGRSKADVEEKWQSYCKEHSLNP